MRRSLQLLMAAATLAALGGCIGGRGSPEAAKPAAPPPEIAGRWTFSAEGGSACAMNFGAPQGPEGTIRPEGGCPGNFYTSRKWTFEDSGLVIRDHNSSALARLRSASPSRYEGQATGGQPVTLTR
jgi:hypothetical protein